MQRTGRRPQEGSLDHANKIQNVSKTREGLWPFLFIKTLSYLYNRTGYETSQNFLLRQPRTFQDERVPCSHADHSSLVAEPGTLCQEGKRDQAQGVLRKSPG